MSRYFRAEVKENLSLNSNHNLLTLSNLDPMDEPLPGQFYMAEVNRGYDPLLKRAFCLFRRVSDGIQVMYRIQGRGTALLREMKAGSVISMLGPLGNGYPQEHQSQTPVVIAGGIGMASVFSTIERLSGRAYVLYGARTRDELFMLDRLRDISKELYLCTDDGSIGEKGNVMDLLNNLFTPHDSPFSLHPSRFTDSIIYSCGPRPMLKAVAELAAARGHRAYLSLEEHMACGIGACLGCVVKTQQHKPENADKDFKYQRVCKEGPVFEAREIVW